ncbi:flagellar biosynthesis protein FlhB [Gilliamella apis]|uniref:flagellar biosynthesis protein FlhB n=1 Tax=Gilliamella apis TaxID=1970738 RepID=UPI0004D96837|nr:flagellar biosynthesis protein FlhB [Gilliamella apis]KES16831.1 Flagellar biosynthesis pathway, component FlhB [Gilliamella apis SCGC AB-598-P17]OTQ62413.1 flagellar biosynthesis protein FlhB [Gilliamella apis]OTQ65190.1 flagellar biosynthesis protein FlhB [Gilliamella apis]OTQ67418.1 flagellar biosynthesis protein FlhB [Gilliamella apis]OTQ69770.1 flagellar biosynthesis protein FlhB [Gilliamella apis]
MADDSDLDKSEQPTDSKLKKAKEKGQIPRSRELTSLIILLVGIMLFWIMGTHFVSKLKAIIQQAMLVAHRTDDDKQIIFNLINLLTAGFWAILPIFVGLVIVAIIAPLSVGGLLFSLQSIKPNLGKLNPISGFKRLFSLRIFSELFKSILKVVLIAFAAALFLIHQFPNMLALPSMYLNNALSQVMQLLIYASLLIVLALIPMVGFDIFYQIWSNLKKLKMSKQEVKDEFKEQEGNPQIKGRIRQMQQAIARRRMMKDVPKANVIVTNPTHYAVALQYDEKTMSAPKILAKGTDNIASKIKQIAQEHQIPQLEAPPLARALYRHGEIGKSIPAELYAAVAQILAWVYQLKRWHRYGGEKPLKPTNLSIPESLYVNK